jgi:predicted transcriptional regulator
MLKVIQENKLLLPQEIEVWYVLPAIRKEFALALIASGLSQKKVAEILGVTGAAVSQYKKEKRAHEFVFDDTFKAEVKKSVERVIQKPLSVFEEMMRIDNYIKQSGLFCKIHRSKSWTPAGCEAVCSQSFLKAEVGHGH